MKSVSCFRKEGCFHRRTLPGSSRLEEWTAVCGLGLQIRIQDAIPRRTHGNPDRAI